MNSLLLQLSKKFRFSRTKYVLEKLKQLYDSPKAQKDPESNEIFDEIVD